MQRVPSAGGVVFDEQGRLLLIERAHDPQAGRWSVPGGKCQPDESTAQACVRELSEETGLSVEIIRLLGTVERDGPGGVVYVIDDFLARVVSGELQAGDDARNACWAGPAELARLPLVDGLADALAHWGVWPS